MTYNSKSLRREHRQKMIDKIVVGLFLVASILALTAAAVFGIWALVSAFDISVHAPTMGGQAPIYWEYNLFALLK